MVQSKPARSVKLADLRSHFNLQRTEAEDFFPEWQTDLPTLTTAEMQRLDQVRRQYLYLLEYPVMEGIVKMTVLSPLMELAGFYEAPFRVTGETGVQVSAEDEGEIIQGNIDVLVLQQQLWIAVIEAKNSELALTKALPQALVYMLANPLPKPSFGLLLNGSEFQFLKLNPATPPQYAVSDIFSLLNRGNNLHPVLSILKKLGNLAIAP
jgi:hypothetical protein